MSEFVIKKKPKKEYIKDLSGKDAFEVVKVDLPRTPPRVTPKPKIISIPDYNDIMTFAKNYMEEDIECEQFFRHGATRFMYKGHYNKERGGGGWSGAIKGTLVILNKMKKKGKL